jgi:hypothetical protein
LLNLEKNMEEHQRKEVELQTAKKSNSVQVGLNRFFGRSSFKLQIIL